MISSIYALTIKPFMNMPDNIQIITIYIIKATTVLYSIIPSHLFGLFKFG